MKATEEVGRILEQVNTTIEQVGVLVSQVNASSREQSQGVEQINRAVAEMDRVVQKNAASAEELASASEEMNAQSEQMKLVVRKLLTVVGGSGNENGKGAISGYLPGPAIKASGRRPGTIHGLQKVSSISMKSAKQKNVPREIKPSQVIPIEDGDFNNF